MRTGRVLLASLALATLAWPASAGAVVLFLDLNDAPSEIKAAKAAAAKRTPPEEVVVVSPPPYTKSEKDEIKKLRKEDDELAARSSKISKTDPDRKAKRSAISDERSALDEKIQAIRKRHMLDATLLRSELAKIKTSGGTVRSMIVSGHSKGYSFFGGDGNKLGLTEIEDAFKEYGMKDGLKSLYLMGCYSGTEASRAWWGGHFKLDFLAGFDGKAPLSTGASPDILGSLMRREAEISAATDEKAMKKQMARVSKVFSSRKGVIDTPFLSCSFGPHGTPGKLTPEKCEELMEFASGMADEQFTPYYFGEDCHRVAKCTPVPEKFKDVPDDQSGAIREFYEKRHAAEGCKPLCGTPAAAGSYKYDWCGTLATTLPRIDVTLSLIKFKHVQEAFGRKFRGEIDVVNTILGGLPADVAKTAGCPSRLPAFSDSKAGSRTKRKEVQQTTSDLFFCAQALKKASAVSKEDSDALLILYGKMNKLLERLECVPDTWLSGGDVVESPLSIPGCEKAYCDSYKSCKDSDVLMDAVPNEVAYK